jgi:hypothetical protein
MCARQATWRGCIKQTTPATAAVAHTLHSTWCGHENQKLAAAQRGDPVLGRVAVRGVPPPPPGLGWSGHASAGQSIWCMWRRCWAELTPVEHACCFIDCWSAIEKCSNDGHYCDVRRCAALVGEASGKMRRAARMSRAACRQRRQVVAQPQDRSKGWLNARGGSADELRRQQKQVVSPRGMRVR